MSPRESDDVIAAKFINKQFFYCKLEMQRKAAKVKPKCAEPVNTVRTTVTTVLASHSQADERYHVFSRDLQCTCTSLIFLAVHSENNDLTSLDLDHILTTGDALYTELKHLLLSEGRFVSDMLLFDELPSTVKTDSHCYRVIKEPHRFGLLRAEAPGGMNQYVNLEKALDCLKTDVTDALLITGGTCIAVFRDRAGRFGFFDPHSRTPDGLANTSDAAKAAGTAVMLTFTNLECMTTRLLLLYQVFLDLKDEDQYELLPVSFSKQKPSIFVEKEKQEKKPRSLSVLHP